MIGASNSFESGDSVEPRGGGDGVDGRATGRALSPWTDAGADRDMPSKGLTLDSFSDCEISHQSSSTD